MVLVWCDGFFPQRPPCPRWVPESPTFLLKARHHQLRILLELLLLLIAVSTLQRTLESACLVGVSGRRGHAQFASLMETPSELNARFSAMEHALPAALLRPRSRSRSPLPRAAPGRSWGSILLSQRGATGLFVKN